MAQKKSEMDEDGARLTELSALVRMGLGKPLDEQTFNRLAAIQSELRHRQEVLDYQLTEGEITAETYLAQFNSSLRLAMDQSQKLLGRERFKSIFGEAGDQPEGLIDRDTFLSQQLHKPTSNP